MKALRPLAIVLICLNPPCVAAHHSDAGYDHDVIVAFEGIVTRYTWRNPHVHVFIQTTDDYGERVIWKIETGSTPILTRSGWTPESLERGDRVSVRAHPERHRERKEAILLSLEKADSSVLAQKDIRPQPPVAASGFSGTWKGRPSEDGPFKERLVNLALTEAGALARDQYDIATENPLSECIAYPTPRLVDSSSYVFEIEQLDDRMYIRSEYLDAARTVYLDTRGHPEDGERTIQGHSIGRWEGDVLVVDTRLFADHRSPNRNGVPSGAQKHVLERYRLSEDHTQLLIDVFMEDPEFLADTFEGSVALYNVPDLKRYEYDCRPEGSEY